MFVQKKADAFDKDGVILLKDVINSGRAQSVRDEYEKVSATLENRDIPKDRPCIVYWRHVEGERKRVGNYQESPELWDLIENNIVPVVRDLLKGLPSGANGKKPFLQLLETIIFDKPPETSNTLHWHQDVAYFPCSPNNQIAVWLPFEPVRRDTGAMNYAVGSHKAGIRGSTDLHTREAYPGEERKLIPANPKEEGFDVVCMEMEPTDMLIHDGYTWHYSGPNKTPGHQRRGLSVRFMREPTFFDPRPGQSAAFTHQITVETGDRIEGLPFPEL